VKAAVLIEAGKSLQIEQVNISNPGPHEVLIRTAACGLCHSDLHFIEGTYPHALPAIPGHEAAGIVEAVGSEVRTVKVGDAVVTCLSAFCGHCEYCVTGRMWQHRQPNAEPVGLCRNDAGARTCVRCD
jgi:S-(hydroxymethyl)glutathione dehydrogenase/alcohol dehydrogenase